MRLRRLEQEFGEALTLRWRAFLLRPQPKERSLEDFIRYTRSWSRPAAESDAGRFRVWESDAGPPSHSVPPHVVHKAAARVAPEAGERMHGRLLESYFWEHRDITDPSTLRGLWRELDLPEAAFPGERPEELLAAIARDHEEAIDMNVGGVPAVRRVDQDVCVVGAQPIEVYRRWIERLLAGTLD